MPEPVYFRYPYIQEPLEAWSYDQMPESELLYRMNRGMSYFEYVNDLIYRYIDGSLVRLYAAETCETLSPYVLDMIRWSRQTDHLEAIEPDCYMRTKAIDLSVVGPFYGYDLMIRLFKEEGLKQLVVMSKGMIYSLGRDYKIFFKAFDIENHFTISKNHFGLKIEREELVVMFLTENPYQAYELFSSTQNMSDDEMLQYLKEHDFAKAIYTIDRTRAEQIK